MQKNICIPPRFFLFYELQQYMMTERYFFQNGVWNRTVNVDGFEFPLENGKVEINIVLGAWNWAKENNIEMVY